MKKNVTISGFAGAGKSTVGRLLSDAMGFEFISVGNFSRKYAKENYGMTINEFQSLLSEKPELDSVIDNKFKAYCNSANSLVIDYRLGFYFVENAIHILLTVTEEDAAKRIALSKRIGEDYSRSAIKKRNQQMRERFFNNYGVDFTHISNYDLIIDTSLSPATEVVSKILASIQTSFQ